MKNEMKKARMRKARKRKKDAFSLSSSLPLLSPLFAKFSNKGDGSYKPTRNYTGIEQCISD